MSDDIAASAAETAPSGQEALNALTPDQRSTWEMTGEWPEPAKVTTTAAEPVDPDEDEPEPAATTAPVEAKAEPTPEKPVSKRQQQINDLIRKATEADIRAKALESEIAALKGKVAPAAEPEKKADAAVVTDPGDPEPQESQFETYALYVKAQARWEIRQAKREADAETKKAQAAHAEQAQRESFETAAKSWSQRRDTFTAKHPEKAERLLTYLDTVVPGTPIGDVLLESEVGAEVGDYLASHPEEADRIARLAPISALRALGKLEAKFDTTLTSASASAGPAGKTVTSAPAPPMTLAARSADPADPVQAAIDRGDYRAYEAETNRRELAKHR